MCAVQNLLTVSQDIQFSSLPLSTMEIFMKHDEVGLLSTDHNDIDHFCTSISVDWMEGGCPG